MAAVVLVDTGPLVALLDRSERERPRVLAAFGALERARFVTSEAVVTEASYLLAAGGGAARVPRSAERPVALQSLLASGRIEVAHVGAEDRARLGALMKQYASLPMDYADATLVLLAERLDTTRVMTLDRRDFGVYRVGRKGFQVLPKG